MKQQRNTTLDLLKVLATYMVVFIHVIFGGKTGVIVDALARFAVPLFFLSSGYFSRGISPEKIKKRIFYILRLLIFASVVCFLWDGREVLLHPGMATLTAYVQRKITLMTVMKLLVFNLAISCEHLWYLLAMLYVYVVFFVTTRLAIRERLQYTIAGGLLVLQLLLGEGLRVAGMEIPEILIRNFLMMGIPFFWLGLFVKQYEDSLKKAPVPAIVLLLIFGIAEVIVSRELFGKNELYLGSVLILLAGVLVFVKYPDVRYPGIISRLSGCSVYIYIFHIMISEMCLMVYGDIWQTSPVLLMTHPLIVSFLSTLLALAIHGCQRKFRSKISS